MVFLTPLELCLEAELERIGIPFRERIDVKAEVDGFLRCVSVPDGVVEKSISDPRLKKAFKRSQAGEGLFRGYLVQRYSVTNSNGVQVHYGVWAGKDSSRKLRELTDYDKILGVLDQILQSRSFFNECVTVTDSKYSSPIHIPYIPGVTREEWDFRLNPPFDPQKTVEEHIKEYEEKERLICITFFKRQVPFANPEIEIRRDLPQDMFYGIKSSVKDAYEIAFRIAKFIQSYNG